MVVAPAAAHVASRHVDAIRSQGADLRRRRRHPGSRGPDHPRGDERSGLAPAAGTGASDPGFRLRGTRGAGQRTRQVIATTDPSRTDRAPARRHGVPDPAGAAPRSAGLHRQSTRSRCCDGGADRFAAGCHSRNGSPDSPGSDESWTVPHSGWTPPSLRRRAAVRRTSRYAGDVFGCVQAGITRRHANSKKKGTRPAPLTFATAALSLAARHAATRCR